VPQAYRFALDPTPAQEQRLRSHARFAWNWGLDQCRKRYEAEKKQDPKLAWWKEDSKCTAGLPQPGPRPS
jgi:hypothetical protein